MSTGSPQKVGAARTGAVGAPTLASGGTGISAATGALATEGGSTWSDVSMIEGGPRRERWERLPWALSEATEDSGGLGMSMSGSKKRIKTGTWMGLDGTGWARAIQEALEDEVL